MYNIKIEDIREAIERAEGELESASKAYEDAMSAYVSRVGGKAGKSCLESLEVQCNTALIRMMNRRNRLNELRRMYGGRV